MQQLIQQTDFLRQREGTDRRGSQQEMTERIQTEQVKMRRHDKQHFENTGELKILLQSPMRERDGERWQQSGQVTMQN
jgi:hypothetical protein